MIGKDGMNCAVEQESCHVGNVGYEGLVEVYAW